VDTTTPVPEPETTLVPCQIEKLTCELGFKVHKETNDLNKRQITESTFFFSWKITIKHIFLSSSRGVFGSSIMSVVFSTIPDSPVSED
jgi:hypothetical protein